MADARGYAFSQHALLRGGLGIPGPGRASAFLSERCCSHRPAHLCRGPIHAEALRRLEALHLDGSGTARLGALDAWERMRTVIFCVVQLDVGQVERDVPVCVHNWVLRKVQCCQLRRGRKAAAVELALDEWKKNSRPHGEASSLSFRGDAVHWVTHKRALGSSACLLETRFVTCGDDTHDGAVAEAVSDDKRLEWLQATLVVRHKLVALARASAALGHAADG